MTELEKAARQALKNIEWMADSSAPPPEVSFTKCAADLRRALEQSAAKEPIKLRRGDILRCIETNELCTVWATSTTHKTLVKWSGNDFTEYTAEQIGELFWLEPESDDLEIAAEQSDNYAAFHAGVRFANTRPQPVAQWVGIDATDFEGVVTSDAFEAGAYWADTKLREKNTGETK